MVHGKKKTSTLPRIGLLHADRMKQVKALEAYFAHHYFSVIKEKGSLTHVTRVGYFGASDVPTVFSAFEQLRLDTYRAFADLGSGNGCVCAVAALFTQATGFEGDEALAQKSTLLQEGISHLSTYTIRTQDFLSADLGPFDVLFINPDQPLDRLMQKLRNWKGLLIIENDLFVPDECRRVGGGCNTIRVGGVTFTTIAFRGE